MGAGEQFLLDDESDPGPTSPLVDDMALLCPTTGRLCPVKVGLREDYQAGDITTAKAREEAGVQLGIALALHAEEFMAGTQICHPDQACPVPSVPFVMAGQRSEAGGTAAAFQGW